VNCRLHHLQCGEKLSPKDFKEVLQEVSRREAARIAAEAVPQFYQDRSPRSRHIFETIIDIANRELMDRASQERDILRRIAMGLERAAQGFDPQAGTTRHISRTARRPTSTLDIQGFGQVAGFGSESQAPVPPQMARVQSAPFGGQLMQSASGHNVPFAGTGPTWSLPFQSPAVPGLSVLPTAPGPSQNPQQQPWPDWSWSQFPGGLGMVTLLT
jgi:hypothetical protein